MTTQAASLYNPRLISVRRNDLRQVNGGIQRSRAAAQRGDATEAKTWAKHASKAAVWLVRHVRELS